MNENKSVDETNNNPFLDMEDIVLDSWYSSMTDKDVWLYSRTVNKCAVTEQIKTIIAEFKVEVDQEYEVNCFDLQIKS